MRTQRFVMASLLSALLAACGGSESSQAPAPGPNPGPTPGPTASDPAVASGTITGFGSTLSVDGVEYSVTGAVVTDDTDPANPAPASLSDLLLGQQVEVELDSTCHLSRIGIGSTLVGLVDPGSIDTAAGRFTVLGQAVTFTASGDHATLFVGVKDAGALAAGRLVTVHGSVDSQGAIRARLVVVLPAGTPLLQRVRGTVQGADAAAHTFKLGSLTVAWEGAKVVPDGATIQDGKAVVVFSRKPATGTAPALTLTADTVRVLHERPRDVVVRLGGPITAVTPVAGQALPDLTLGGLRVATSKAKLEGGAKATDLVVGAVVRVEGTMEGGVLIAREIAVVPVEVERRVVLSGRVSSFDGPASFVVRGTTVDGSSATFTPGSSAAQLADGVMVTVLGHVSGSKVVADQITVHLPPQDVEMTLSGVVSHVDPAEATSTFELLGIDMRLDPEVSWTGGTAADLVNGAHVQVTGAYHGEVFVVTAVRFLGAGPARPVRVHLSGLVTELEPATASTTFEPATASTTFVLNHVTITVDAATEIVNGPLAEGQRVLVLAEKAAGGVTLALRIEIFRAPPEICPAVVGGRCGPAERPVYLTGAVSEVEGATFEVDSQAVDASAATFAPQGTSAADLRVGRTVAVEGTMKKGVLVASAVRFLR